LPISTTSRKAGPYPGNGVARDFSFNFKIFAPSELRVSVTNSAGAEQVLGFNTDYTVSLSPDQDADAGGVVTLNRALASGSRLVILSDVALLQPIDMTNQGGFYPDVVNEGFDRATVQIQQLGETVGRAVTVPPSTPDGTDLSLPEPDAGKLLAWGANGLHNLDPDSLITFAAYGDTVVDKFWADGSQTLFTLSADPAAENNLRVSVDGVTQTPSEDFVWEGGTALRFLSAPPNGTRILVQFLRGLAETGGASKADLIPKADRVPSLAALRAWPLARPVYLEEEGREGWFRPVQGDQSANVASDPASGVWVAPMGQSGAEGAWRRVFSGAASPRWFGAVGDGVTDDSAAFAALEVVIKDGEVDLGGRTYKVASGPVGNGYYGGEFLIDGVAYSATNTAAVKSWSLPNRVAGPGPGGVAIGEGAAVNIPSYTEWSGSTGYIAIGRDALGSAERGRACIAIGPGAMDTTTRPGFDNLAIGAFTLRHVYGEESLAASSVPGSRNIAIGSLAGYAITSGYQNVLIGRDAGHCLTTANESTGVGYRALSAGKAPMGLDSKIHVQVTGTATGQTAFGKDCLKNGNGNGNTGIGRRAGQNIKSGTLNFFAGNEAGDALDGDLSENNKVITLPNLTGTYTQTGTVITVSITAHGAIAGNKVGIRFTSGQPFDATTGDMQWLTVATVLDANSFTITSPVSQTASGNCVLGQVETATTRSGSSTNTFVGCQAGYQAPSAQGVTAVGWQSAAVFGGLNSTFVGQRAGMSATAGEGVTALGTNALRNNVGGGVYLGGNNVTGVGFDSRVSGDNQVQLGNSDTTTYVYGTVQNRSDERDKADIRDTTLGLDFILALRPVDYRWDMREDYAGVEEHDVVREYTKWVSKSDGAGGLDYRPVKTTVLEREEFVTKREKDGSKKRSRFHHGFVAQEVQQLIADGVIEDFGGFQDHSVNGGCDVQSIGYDELIAPLVKAVQELSARVEELERKR
jgi:trimeric autotransporter adhesin